MRRGIFLLVFAYELIIIRTDIFKYPKHIYNRRPDLLTYDLDKRGNKTMYEYLYELIKEDISDGKLKADEKRHQSEGFHSICR